MFLPDDTTAVAVLPTPGAVGPNPNYYFGPGTIVTPDLLNAVWLELAYCITQNGGTLSKTNRTQLYAAIQAMCGANYAFNLSSPPGTDLVLNVRDRLTITAAGVSSLPLHVAVTPGQIYKVSAIITATNSTNVDIYLQPNNTGHANSFSAWNTGATDDVVSALGTTTAGATRAPITASPFLGDIPLSSAVIGTASAFYHDMFTNSGSSDTVNNFGPWTLDYLISTATVAKFVKSTGAVRGGPSGAFSVWNDTTTAWSSLGTISDNFATSMTGTVMVERVA